MARVKFSGIISAYGGTSSRVGGLLPQQHSRKFLIRLYALSASAVFERSSSAQTGTGRLPGRTLATRPAADKPFPSDLLTSFAFCGHLHAECIQWRASHPAAGTVPHLIHDGNARSSPAAVDIEIILRYRLLMANSGAIQAPCAGVSHRAVLGSVSLESFP